MAEIYKAVFKCPELNEKEVWFVSSRKHAQTMLNMQRPMNVVSSSLGLGVGMGIRCGVQIVRYHILPLLPSGRWV